MSAERDGWGCWCEKDGYLKGKWLRVCFGGEEWSHGWKVDELIVVCVSCPVFKKSFELPVDRVPIVTANRLYYRVDWAQVVDSRRRSGLLNTVQ